MKRVRAVVFDAVGTLMTPEPSAAETYYHIGRRHGSHRRREEVVLRFSKAFRNGRDCDGDDPFRTDENRESGFWRDVVSAVFDELPPETLDNCFRDLFDHFARPDAWRIYPDVAESLAGLRAIGLQTAVASNFDARLHGVLAGHSERTLLDRCFVSSEIGWKKPDRRFFTAVCDMLGCAAAEVIYVGDEPETDVEAARVAGLRALLINREGKTDGSLTDLRDVAVCLARPIPPTAHQFTS